MTTPPHDLSELLRWAEGWLPSLAPLDLAGRPVYILDQRLPERLEACTGPAVDLAYRAEIGQRWRGRGVAILVDLNRFHLDTRRLREVSSADEATIAAMQGYVAKAILAVLIHEMSHVLLWAPETTAPLTNDARQARVVVDAAISPPARAADSISPVPFDGHRADFVRAAIHLCHRADRQRVAVPLAGMAAGLRYFMAPPESYRSALADEPQRLAGELLARLPEIPPPAEFSALWRSDLTAWFKRITSPTEQQADALFHGLRLFPLPEMNDPEVNEAARDEAESQ